MAHPRVPDDPVLLSGLLVFSEASDANNVVGLGASARIVQDVPLVVPQRIGVDGSRNRAPRVYLGLDLVHLLLLAREQIHDPVPYLTVLRHGRVGEVVELDALPSLVGEAAAGSTSVDGAAARVDLGAKPLLGLGRAGEVWLARLVRDVAELLNQLVDTRVVSPVAGTGLASSAVENPLDAQVDVLPLALAGDLDPVHEGTHGAVGPTAPAVMLFHRQ